MTRRADSAPQAVAVGVPVRNEVVRLPRLLDALAAQRKAPPFTLCLFFDECDDGSAELVEARAHALPFRIATDSGHGGGPPNAGRARRRAMALAAEHVADDGVLLTTDADGEPASDWIAANLRALAKADVIAGWIDHGGSAGSEMAGRLGRYLDALQRLRRTIDPVSWEDADVHHWTSGASLGMTASTYRELGGFDARPNGEDAALCDAAMRRGLRLRRDGSVVVRTSARRQGRAPDGFAATLRRIERDGAEPCVFHPADEVWRFIRQAQARSVHGSDRLTPLAGSLGLSLDEVREVAAECRNGEAFAARIVGAPACGMRHVALSVAEALLPLAPAGSLEGAA